MKTPREVLLATHKPIEPRLDSLRRDVVARISNSSTPAPRAPHTDAGLLGDGTWLAMLRMLRWHLAGLSGVWMLIVVLRASGGAGDTSPPVADQPASSRSVIFSLRENRRQILESDNESNFAAPAQEAIPQSRHGRIRLNQAVVII